MDKNINRMLSIAKAIDVATPVTTATTETILAQKQQPAAEKMFKSAVNDSGHIVIERDDKLLVRIKVKALLKVLAGDKVTNNSLRIYYQNPEDSGDMQCKR